MLQIQPQYTNRTQWTALSRREGLSFEVLEPFTPPMNMDPGLFSAGMEWYKSCGNVTAVHGAFIDVNPASGDPDFRALSRKRCEESCRMAAELGAGFVVLHSSCFPFLRGAYLEHWAAGCADFYGELAQRYGIGIRVENSQDLDPAPLKALMQRTKGADVAVCLDIGHAACSRAPIEEWFGELGAEIAYLHLSDNLGAFDDHLPIGAGSIDWQQADSLFRQLNRPMPMTLEVGGIEGVEQSLNFLRRNHYFGIEE